MKSLNVSFNEEQRIDQWWLKIILLVTLGIMIVSVIPYFLHLKDHNTTSLIIVLVSSSLGLSAIGLVWFWKLTTCIDNYGITIKCPFVNKKVNWDEIERLEVLDYGFVGGWGVRIGTKYGTVYNTSGSKGMAVVLKNKKKFLIGTQKENELKKLEEKWKNTY